jgi:hypothetical protein
MVASGNTTSITTITVIVTIVTTILTGLFQLLSVWYNHMLNKRKKSLKPKLHDVVKNSLTIDKILFEILQECVADRVIFARFHNGGTFIDGVPIDKFSVANEVYTSDEMSVSLQLQNVLLSTRPSAMYELLFTDSFFREDTSTYTSGFEKMLFNYDVKSIYMFLIKDLDDKPIGFVELSYINNKNVLDEESKLFIKLQHNKILKLAQYRNESK